jgi:hypothetical protein
MRWLVSLMVVSALAVPACRDDDTDDPSAGPATPGRDSGGPGPEDDGTPSEDAAAPPAACPRTAAAADRARKVVVSHPFANGGGKAGTFEVLSLSQTGELTKTGETFEMGPAYSEIVFTPDGKVGLVAEDDGSLGVFTFDDKGKVKIVHASFKGDFYARHVVVARDGTRAFVLDEQTEKNGGGVYEVAIGCDGTLTSKGLVVPGGTAHAMALMPNDPDRAVLIAGKAMGSPANTYAHRLDVSTTVPKLLASGGVFPDAEAIASWVSITRDGKYALVTDNGFSVGSRVAAVALDTMKPLAPIATTATKNPVAFVMSPFDNAGLLLNSDGEDALRVVRYDASNAATPFTIGAEVTYVGGKTELPTLAFTIDRGALKGRVLVAELQSVRQLTFSSDGKLTDLGPVKLGEGSTSVVGSLGIEP